MMNVLLETQMQLWFVANMKIDKTEQLSGWKKQKRNQQYVTAIK